MFLFKQTRHWEYYMCFHFIVLRTCLFCSFLGEIINSGLVVFKFIIPAKRIFIASTNVKLSLDLLNCSKQGRFIINRKIYIHFQRLSKWKHMQIYIVSLKVLTCTCE